jgi:hypothetical protein
MRHPTALISLLALAGCASIPGMDKDEPAVAISNGVEVARAVQLCQSSVASLEAQLGRPSRDGRLGRTRVVTWIVEWEPLVKYLGVMADEAGTVVDVAWNLPSEVQWSPTNRCK